MAKNIILLIFATLLCTQGMGAYAILIDPTKPPDFTLHPSGSAILTSASAMELTEVIVANNQKFAIINGQIYKIGDKILGNQLMTIGLDHVQLQGPTGSTVLYLFGKSIKQAK